MQRDELKAAAELQGDDFNFVSPKSFLHFEINFLQSLCDDRAKNDSNLQAARWMEQLQWSFNYFSYPLTVLPREARLPRIPVDIVISIGTFSPNKRQIEFLSPGNSPAHIPLSFCRFLENNLDERDQQMFDSLKIINHRSCWARTFRYTWDMQFQLNDCS